MRVTACLLVACAMFAVGDLQSAHADPAPQSHLCTGGPEVAWDRQITACTALIKSGKETPHDAAVSYVNRGNAYLYRGELDRHCGL